MNVRRKEQTIEKIYYWISFSSLLSTFEEPTVQQFFFWRHKPPEKLIWLTWPIYIFQNRWCTVSCGISPQEKGRGIVVIHTHFKRANWTKRGKKDDNECIFFLRNFFNLEIKVLSRGLLENAYIFSYEKETTFEKWADACLPTRFRELLYENCALPVSILIKRDYTL